MQTTQSRKVSLVKETIVYNLICLYLLVSTHTVIGQCSGPNRRVRFLQNCLVIYRQLFHRHLKQVRV